MSNWGRSIYGDPCHECGYEWSGDVDAAVEVIRHTPHQVRAALAGCDGTATAVDLGWDARAYVCHIGDNLRIWAERLIAAIGVPELAIGAYDADQLATARNYSAIPLSAALWSLEGAVGAWQSAVETSRPAKITLLHPDRGRLHLADVASANAHDAHHHLHDIRRCVAGQAARRH